MPRFAYCSPGEAAAATRLVDALLKDGRTVSVNDGEQWTVKRSTDRDAILDAMNTTGEDTLRARRRDGSTLGSFLLIYGNAADGTELIADHTANSDCEAIYLTVYPE